MTYLNKAYIQQGPVGDTVLADLGFVQSGMFAPDRDALLIEEAFQARGLATERFIPKQSERSQLDWDPTIMVAGDVKCVQRHLRRLGVEVPPPDDYPVAFQHLLGRSVTATTYRRAIDCAARGSIFVKPRERVKHFTGFVMGDVGDCYAAPHVGLNESVWVSETVAFLTEYRLFFVFGQCVGTRLVPTTERHLPTAASPDTAPFLAAAAVHADALPAAYLLDVGVTAEGRTLLVECNDAYACGAYGLEADVYASVLATRWVELVHGRAAAREFYLEWNSSVLPTDWSLAPNPVITSAL